MMRFSYRAVTSDGTPRNGSLEAPGKAQAVQSLQQSGLVVLSLSAAGEPGASGGGSRALTGRISAPQLVDFAIETSALLDAKVPLEQVLKTQADLCTHPRFKEVLTAVWQDVNGGASFADALARHPKIFERFFVNMVRGGEASGALELIMRRVAALLERRMQLRSKVTGALIYPSLVMVLGVAVVSGMMLFVVPKIISMVGESGQLLPVSTRAVIAVSNFTRSSWWLFPLAVVGLFYLYKMKTRSEEGKVAFGRMILKIPLFGTLIAQAETSRFCRMMSSLLDGQVPILSALSITGSTLGNAALRQLMKEVYSRVQGGQPMGPLLQASPEFPELASRMITMGEESGELQNMLNKVADRYEEKVTATTERLVGVIEPVSIIIIGLIVGFIVVGMVQGIMTMSTSTG
ncbi:MAG TPA: type II secretion system F family protein [Pontiellaceae bacterium]|nr:type II secretion system F family protein [Pontiellaceae bacterium]